VKIQSRTIKKRYKKGKREYRYKQHLLPFPTKQNENLKPFLHRELQFKMNAKDDVLNVTLTKEKETLNKHSENA
jgi:hypothetical protein